MYAPVGFYPFSELAGFCDHASSAVFAARVLNKYEIFENNQYKKIHVREQEFLTTWMISKSMSEFQPHICSPSGQILVAAPLLCFHEDRLGWYDWSWPLADSHELSIPFARYLHDGPHPMSRFRFIDAITGTISVKLRRQEIQDFSQESDECIKQQISVAENFDGWAVCFAEGDIPDNVGGLCSALGIHEPYIEMTEPRSVTAKRGRPYLQDSARDAYRSIYPTGHGNIPWVEVEDNVAALMGRRISSKTIRRAVSEIQDNLDKK